jgi:hypothetical protein
MSYYEKLKAIMLQNNCTLLTTSNEYIQMVKDTRYAKVKYIASCGHEHEVGSYIFMNRKTGIICPRCMSKKNNMGKRGLMNCENGQCINVKMEDDSIQYLQTNLNEHFSTVKTKEGCLADMIIKPKNVDEDKWMLVQVKTTTKPLRDYGFKCSSKYKNCIIICVCLSDKRMWILNGNDITVKCKIAIGLKKSKYDKNEVNLDNIADSIHKYYDVMLPITYDIANLPQSICQQQEQEYRKFVESKCPNIKFDYPVYNQLVYDFTVNGHKVQEKVGTYRKDRNETVIFTLHKSNGKQDGVRKFKIYNECDNDFYWLNFPDKKHFYIFPEMELIKLGILSTEKQKGSGIIYITMSKISNTKYGVKYLFDYENLDESRIMELFKREHIIP